MPDLRGRRGCGRGLLLHRKLTGRWARGQRGWLAEGRLKKKPENSGWGGFRRPAKTGGRQLGQATRLPERAPARRNAGCRLSGALALARGQSGPPDAEQECPPRISGFAESRGGGGKICTAARAERARWSRRRDADTRAVRGASAEGHLQQSRGNFDD